VSSKGGRYHHGDLRVALIETAVELIAERGVRNFSLTEASRRLGVAASAPYAHFEDRDSLLAAVAVHALKLFDSELRSETEHLAAPAGRLAAIARAYVRFAGTHRALFELVFEAGVDKARHPEIAEAERPIDDAFLACVRALSDGDEETVERLATAIEATAHGHAMLLLDGRLGEGGEAVERTAENAARATLALIQSRRVLADPLDTGVRV
jgi:AcrR family transcriptional regulator